VLSSFIQATHANGYLTGEDHAVLWTTKQVVSACNGSISTEVISMELTDPSLQGIHLKFSMPDTLTDGVPSQASITFELADSWTIVKDSGFMLPHVNIHSCLSKIGACTPFIKNTPGLSTHTEAVKRDITTTTTPGRWSLSEKMQVTLDAGSYMAIAHVRFFTSAGKYDVAYGLPRTVQPVPPKETTDEKVMLILLIVLGSCLTAAGVFFFVRFLYQSIQQFAALSQVKKKLVQQKLDAALEASEHLDYPVTLISANNFISLGRLRMHEDVRDENKLVFKDTLKSVAIFKKKHKILFFSHQWTAWTEPDHTSKQYAAMTQSLKTIVQDFGWDLDTCYVWCDYLSIPQCVGSVQLLAIHTLTAYSSVADTFIAVCPDLAHKETGTTLGMESYRDRMWCRAEQACYALKNGSTLMWMVTEKEGNPDELKVERMGEEWLQIVLRVFEGSATCCERKHIGMESCDRNSLVIPLLSLYAEWYAAREMQLTHLTPQRVVNTIAGMLDEKNLQSKMFPPSFGFMQMDGEVVEQELFGTLVDSMEAHLDAHPELKAILNGSETQASRLEGAVPKRPAKETRASKPEGIEMTEISRRASSRLQDADTLLVNEGVFGVVGVATGPPTSDLMGPSRRRSSVRES